MRYSAGDLCRVKPCEYPAPLYDSWEGSLTTSNKCGEAHNYAILLVLNEPLTVVGHVGVRVLVSGTGLVGWIYEKELLKVS